MHNQQNKWWIHYVISNRGITTQKNTVVIYLHTSPRVKLKNTLSTMAVNNRFRVSHSLWVGTKLYLQTRFSGKINSNNTVSRIQNQIVCKKNTRDGTIIHKVKNKDIFCNVVFFMFYSLKHAANNLLAAGKNHHKTHTCTVILYYDFSFSLKKIRMWKSFSFWWK